MESHELFYSIGGIWWKNYCIKTIPQRYYKLAHERHDMAKGEEFILVEGFSIVSYKGKTILSFDFSNLGKSKEKTMQLIGAIREEYSKNPLESVLVFFNVTNIYFDMDMLNAFKETRDKFGKYEKKVAAIGITGILKTGYNFVVGLTKNNSSLKTFDSELEAKEWLVSD
jgi:hypothetical protein